MVELSGYLSAFMLGILGSAHCLGMCGGLVSALGLHGAGSGSGSGIYPDQAHPAKHYLLTYNFGRIISYTLAGLIVGLFGFWLSRQLGAAIFLRYLAAVMLILLGLYLGQWFNALGPVEKAGGLLWRQIQPLARRFIPIRSSGQALFVGMVWGWLPCGLVYSALIYASAAGHPLDAALVMLSFGLGTLPSMLATGLFSVQISKLVANRWFRSGAGSLMILYGLWSLPLIQSRLLGAG